MKGFKRAAALMMALAMTASCVTGCSKKFDGTEVVAEVGDAQITADVMNFYARYEQSQYSMYANILGDDMWTEEDENGETREERIKKSLAETLEQMYVIEQHMADYNVELTEDEKAAIEKAAAEFVESNTLEVKEAVSGDQETVERVLTLATIREKMYVEMVKDVDTEVSDEEARQKGTQYVFLSYTTTDADGNSVDMTEEEKEALKADAAAFLEGAKQAEDFEAYAEEKGYTAQTTTFDANSALDENLIAALDQLKEGEFTDVIETENGLYVAKLTSLLDREATDYKKETIVAQRQQDAFDEIVDGWMEETEITLYEKVLKKIDFVKVNVTIKEEETEE